MAIGLHLRGTFLFFILQWMGCKGYKVNNLRPYISGGLEAKPGQFPYMAYIIFVRNLDRSSGCLVSESKVISVAPYEPANVKVEDIVVFCGLLDTSVADDEDEVLEASLKENGGYVQKRFGKELVIHDKFTRLRDGGFLHDLSILTVNESFIMTKTVQVIQISADKMLEPTNCTILGYGITEKNPFNTKLRYATSVLAQPVSYGCPLTTEGNIYCLAKQRGMACIGDGGSPLVCDGMVKGINSYGAHGDCGESEEEAYVDLSGEKEFLTGRVPFVSSAALKAGIAMPLVGCFQLLVNLLNIDAVSFMVQAWIVSGMI